MKRLLIFTISSIALAQQPVGTVRLDQGVTAVQIPSLRGPGAPTMICNALVNLGIVYTRIDAAANGSSVYVCAKTGPTTYQWEGPFDGGGSGGNVSNVTASAPILSSGGTNPNISLASPLPASNGGTGVSNAGTISTGSSSINFGSLGTGLVKNTTGTGALSNGTSADVAGLWAACSSGNPLLRFDGVCGAGGGGGLPASIIDAIAAGVVCDGVIDNTVVMNILLSHPGGTIYMPPTGDCMVGNLVVSANQVTLYGGGSTLKFKSGGTGLMMTMNGISAFASLGNIFDGNGQTALTNMIEIDNSSNVHFIGNVIQNTGAPGTSIFQHGLEIFQSSGYFEGNHITNISGYCMHVVGTTASMIILGNHVDHCYKNGIVNQSGGPYVSIAGNQIDHIYDWGAGGGAGAAGNGIYVSTSTGGTYGPNTISQTEYSGVRVASSQGINIVGGLFYQTGDWAVYLNDFSGGNNSVTGTTIYNVLGGGINCANGGDNAAFGCHIVSNQIYNMGGSSTNAGSLTPTYGDCVVADTFVDVTANTCDGAYYGINVDNGEIGQFVQVGTNVTNNTIADSRLVTLAITGTAGTVVGAQNGNATDKIYVGGTLSTAATSGIVITCLPITVGMTCASPTSITVKTVRGLFTAGQSIVDNGPTGNLTATISTVTTSANYDLTLSSLTGFGLFDDVHTGTGMTRADGFIGCLGTQTFLGCTVGHIMVIGRPNASGLMVPFPATGVLTDDTASTTATISARVTHPNYLHVGIMLPHGEQDGSCAVLADGNKIWGFSTRPYSGVTNAANVPDGNDTQSIGDGVCINRSQMNGPPPFISSGFGTSSAFNTQPPSDTSFTINVGTGGATSGIVTWGTPYTTYPPDCSEGHKLTNAVTRLNAGLTTLTISSTTAWSNNDLISVTCSGGK